MERHAFDSVDFFVRERLIAGIALFVLVIILIIFILFLVIIVVLAKSLLQRTNRRVVGNDLRKNGQMRIEKLPSGLQDQINRVF